MFETKYNIFHQTNCRLMVFVCITYRKSRSECLCLLFGYVFLFSFFFETEQSCQIEIYVFLLSCTAGHRPLSHCLLYIFHIHYIIINGMRFFGLPIWLKHWKKFRCNAHLKKKRGKNPLFIWQFRSFPNERKKSVCQTKYKNQISFADA